MNTPGALILLVLLALPSLAQDNRLHIRSTGPQGNVSIAAESIERGATYPSTIKLRGRVEVKWKGMQLSADEADYNEATGELQPRGNVTLKPYAWRPAEPARKLP
jgi:lipopolysaccharide assembly outer membrane protein LptD (OstA)